MKNICFCNNSVPLAVTHIERFKYVLTLFINANKSNAQCHHAAPKAELLFCTVFPQRRVSTAQYKETTCEDNELHRFPFTFKMLVSPPLNPLGSKLKLNTKSIANKLLYFSLQSELFSKYIVIIIIMIIVIIIIIPTWRQHTFSKVKSNIDLESGVLFTIQYVCVVMSLWLGRLNVLYVKSPDEIWRNSWERVSIHVRPPSMSVLVCSGYNPTWLRPKISHRFLPSSLPLLSSSPPSLFLTRSCYGRWAGPGLRGQDDVVGVRAVWERGRHAAGGI